MWTMHATFRATAEHVAAEVTMFFQCDDGSQKRQPYEQPARHFLIINKHVSFVKNRLRDTLGRLFNE